MDIALEKKLSGFKQIALEKLENILLTILGKKDLVISPDLIRILDSFANMTWLKSKGFDRIFKLSSSPPPKTKVLVFMIQADLITFKYVCDQISFLKDKHSSFDPGEVLKDFHIIVIPNLFFTFQNLLETEGLHGIVELHRFSWDFIKIDRNLLSLELPQVFKEVFVRNDKSLLSSIASSLRIFNIVHGRPKFIVSYGENSDKILSMVSRMESMRKSSAKEKQDFPDFHAMIVMDRNKDFPSCLLTPVTYSGLMVELFETKAGILSIENESNKNKSGKINILNVEKDQMNDEKDIKTLRMCGNSDEIYTTNKYRHFSEVVNLIKWESKNLEGEKNKYSRDMNIEQMKEFVEKNLPKVAAQKKILYKHLVICEKIVQEMSGNFERQQNIEDTILRNDNKKQILNYIHEQLYTNAHQYNILCLICLLHICVGGLSSDEVNKFVGGYLNTFGHKHLEMFQGLMKAKLFPDINQVSSKNLIGIAQSTIPKKTQFQIHAGKLKMIPGDEIGSTAGPPMACPSYVFNGNFIPLVVQLASALLQAKDATELLSKVGHLEQLKLTGSFIGDDLEPFKDAVLSNLKILPIKPRTLFIFIVGGVTYAETAACSLIESLTGSTIVLASDQITSGIDLMKAAS
ncbi:CLUMA_CG005700, isoform A [Clunio marinus]|uniref:CLUMA_CG005700, isoform A n=1 Tax=Clunio marinus TaxID=568069 RepID=A0A1J1HY38_9DIPT|nr:CLUMA_CG005700, isoform A [Clunio marinus]